MATIQRRAAVRGLSLAWLLAAALQGGCGGGAAPGTGFSEAPDILLVVVDALRRDHVGAYGYPRPTTPFLDRLAADGVVFDKAYAQAPQTFNSTSTLLTSRYFPYLTETARFEPIPGFDAETQQRHSRVPGLAEANSTLPERLREAGYETAGFFTNPHHHATSGFWQGFDAAEFLPPDSRTAYARAPKVHRAFFRWLDRRTSKDEPYFAYLHFMDAHSPYRPSRKLRRLFATVKGRDLYTSGKPAETPTDDDVAYMKNLYDAEIRLVDGVLEGIVADLETRGAWRDTVLVVTSDHGDEFMEHGGFGHGMTLEEEMIRIPLIIAAAAPSSVRPGRYQHLVRNLDVAPTLLELAGVTRPPELEGVSLAPALAGSELTEHPGTSLAWIRALRSWTDRDWHFVWDLASDEKILRRDSSPTENVAELHPQVVRRFSREIARLERARVESLRFMAEHPEQATPGGVDPAILEQLEALGYM